MSLSKLLLINVGAILYGDDFAVGDLTRYQFVRSKGDNSNFTQKQEHTYLRSIPKRALLSAWRQP